MKKYNGLLQKILCVVLIMSMIFSVGCKFNERNDKPKGDRPAGKKIVIVNGGSSEYRVVKGSEEDAVIEAIEQKYYEDTGISLDFEIQYLGVNMRSIVGTKLEAKDQLDILVSHLGYGSGIDEYAVKNNIYSDYTALLEEYGENILKKVPADAFKKLTTVDKKIIGIPSVIDYKKFGVLVRKDYMEQAGFTDDASKVATKGLKLVDNLKVFEEMCIAITDITGYNYALSGAPWDLEKVLTMGAYAKAGYFGYAVDYDENKNIKSIKNGFVDDDYAKVIETEYRWAKNGVWSKESESTPLDYFENEFISGKTGVFVANPTYENLVKIARQTKLQDAKAEFTILGSLDGANGEKTNGFLRNSRATFGAVILKSSQNATDIIKFFDWMYKDVNNYELCTYGIKGEHWIDAGNGKKDYPADKKGKYSKTAPYSGALGMVENQEISYRMSSDYTSEELAWLEIVKNAKYIDNPTTDILLPIAPKEMQDTFQQALNQNYYLGLASPAWTGLTNPASNFPGSTDTYFEHCQKLFVNQTSDYYKWLTNQISLMI